MIKLYIETGNAAFEDENKNLEVARIIAEAAEKLGSARSGVNLRDYNGNTVGKLMESDADIELEPGSSYVKLEMDTDNSAFEDDAFDYECARIMREAADRIRNGQLDFKLRDVNGNTVGSVKEVLFEQAEKRKPFGL